MGRRNVLLGSLAVIAAVLVLVGGIGTMAWGDSLRQEQRLLPGTTIADVDVGDLTVAAALTAVRESVAEALDRPVRVAAAGRHWTTSARELDATSDAERVVAEAFERTRHASLVALARLRLGAGTPSDREVTLDVPDDVVDTYVAGIAGEVDTAPRDATLAWADGSVRLEDAVTGMRVRRPDAATALEAAVEAGRPAVELPVEARAPAFPTPEAERVATEVGGRLRAALDHRVTVALDETAVTVTPRGLGTAHNADALLASRAAGPGDVVLELDDTAIDEVVDEVASPHELPAHDADLAWSVSGGFAVTPHRTGLAVDRVDARDRLRAALLGGSDKVELGLHDTTPGITTTSFDQVLLVRQAARRVELYRGGRVVRSWPVAVGTSGHPTPTGLFTIGARRFEPTWHNSSPDGWGADMPAVIGPGPDNPLGVRALNWERNGHDTLIRFHGTANRASIGRAASHGCVRMLNADVVELYDLVGSGTVVLSVAG